MKVLFLIDHATKSDAIHHAIGAYVHPDSSEMVLPMRKYLSDRSSFQSHFFCQGTENLRAIHVAVGVSRKSGEARQ